MAAKLTVEAKESQGSKGKSSIRSPVCTVVGHVDHGKSSLLDKIRQSSITSTEQGGITQAIGASFIPISRITECCGDLAKRMGLKFTIPGLLAIDTPGHAAFSSLRKRGGSLADIAILVVDVNDGFMPQTIEAAEVLKAFKTPFIVAATKVDLIQGWQSKPSLAEALASLPEQAQARLDTGIYSIVGKLSELGFNSDRFDRVNDFTKEIAVVPISNITGDGIPELLILIAGLAQKYLEQSLKINVQGRAKGTILEVKEQKGIGACVDAVIYDGSLSVGDTIVIGSVNSSNSGSNSNSNFEPLITKVKAIFRPAELSEMRDSKTKFVPAKKVCAALGVRISAPNLEHAMAGMPLRSCGDDKTSIDAAANDVKQEISEVMIENDEHGVIVKADSLGSLEAVVQLLKTAGIPVMKCSIGKITREDIADASASYEKNPLEAVVFGFNTSMTKDAELNTKESNCKVITSDIIYRLIDEYNAWVEEEKKRIESESLNEITRPCKFQIMTGYVFRQSNPAIAGVDVLGGNLHNGSSVMKNGRTIGTVKELQHEKKNISVAKEGSQVAASIDGITIGRQVSEGDFLYVFINEDDFRELKKHKHLLTPHEKSVMHEMADMMRKENPTWGI